MFLSWEKSNDTKNYSCPDKTLAYNLYMFLYWGEILTHDCMLTFTHQPHKMIKRTKAIRPQQPMNCFGVFDHFVGLALKGLGNMT